ncbi:MAG: hypothetical protein CSB13_09130 [Chloroflexi bacterium]|nr:MAG: hypothetical protein CSB13_09130 [Chloroflexota bacterium]
MSKSANVELTQLKTAVHYFVGLLEEGSLVKNYDSSTRDEIAEVLELIIGKVEGLPEEVPENLVQAAVVRSIVGAAERLRRQESEAFLSRQMREAEAAASIHGHTLSDWEQVTGEEGVEYQAACTDCGGFIYVSLSGTYNLLLDSCERV